MKINIGLPRVQKDPNYRYKRDSIEVSYEAKTGGTTKILNLYDICLNLSKCTGDVSVLPTLTKKIISMIQKDSGTLIETVGTDKNAKFFARGNISAEKIEKIIVDFTLKYILCPNCHLPEWNREICRSCGYQKNQKIDNAKVAKMHKELITDFKSVEEIEKESEENILETNSEFDIEVSHYMKKLYDIRTSELKKNNDVKNLDHALNSCWKWNEDTWITNKNRVISLIESYQLDSGR